jgi:predicted nuclease of predicted toxin-antitoxin system
MRLRLVIDVNLSPDWLAALAANGWQSLHWCSVGSPRAKDREIMANAHIVFTDDLDFGTMLALTHVNGPSVPQVRSQNVLPDFLAPVVVAAPRQHEADLAAGALVVVDETKAQIRLLPI